MVPRNSWFKLRKKNRTEVRRGSRGLTGSKGSRVSKGSKSTGKLFIETSGTFRTFSTC